MRLEKRLHWAMVIVLLVVFTTAAVVHSQWFAPARLESEGPESAAKHPRPVRLDLAHRPDYQILPYYIDLKIGQEVQILRPGGDLLTFRVAGIKAESRALRAPRTRVDLAVGDRIHAVRCGMASRTRGGIEPITIDGVKIAAEITRLVFSSMRGGSSPFNNYDAFRLRGDVRLAIWDARRSILLGTPGAFVIEQEEWIRDRYGNWLHRTGYGIHGAIDVYATQPGVPEPVVSPVDGIVYRVYNEDAAADDVRRNKVINLFGSAVVGPRGERILYRFQHLSEILVESEQTVRQGQVIGMTGHTGFAPRIGDHLHFEMRLNPSCLGFEKDDSLFATIPINPYNYLLEWYSNRTERSSSPR